MPDESLCCFLSIFNSFHHLFRCKPCIQRIQVSPCDSPIKTSCVTPFFAGLPRKGALPQRVRLHAMLLTIPRHGAPTKPGCRIVKTRSNRLLKFRLRLLGLEKECCTGCLQSLHPFSYIRKPGNIRSRPSSLCSIKESAFDVPYRSKPIRAAVKTLRKQHENSES